VEGGEKIEWRESGSGSQKSKDLAEKERNQREPVPPSHSRKRREEKIITGGKCACRYGEKVEKRELIARSYRYLRSRQKRRINKKNSRRRQRPLVPGKKKKPKKSRKESYAIEGSPLNGEQTKIEETKELQPVRFFCGEKERSSPRRIL